MTWIIWKIRLLLIAIYHAPKKWLCNHNLKLIKVIETDYRYYIYGKPVGDFFTETTEHYKCEKCNWEYKQKL